MTRTDTDIIKGCQATYSSNIMKDIIREVLSKIDTASVLKSVTNKGLEKLTASAFGAMVLDLGTIFGLFIVLAIIDIITKCASLSAELCRRTYGEEFTKRFLTFIYFVKHIPHAYSWRLVNSSQMKNGFVSKMLVYMLLLITSCICDMLLPTNIQAMRMLVTSILALTELISVCENLSLCNVEVAQTIKNLVSKRKEHIK